MKLSDFDFDLPPGAVAERPSGQRDKSRLLVVHRDGPFDHRHFCDLPDYLKRGDLLLLNDSRVFPARLLARKPTGGKIDILLVKRLDASLWEVLCRNRYTGPVRVGGAVSAEVWTEPKRRPKEPGSPVPEVRHRKFLRFLPEQGEDDREIIWQHGLMPLPPYIRRSPDNSDRERYQTVYAEREGSIAAPTAGLHFTRDLLSTLAARGVLLRTVTLHVGIGTFRPITSQTIEAHRMDAEHFDLDASLLNEVRAVKASGCRVFAVGTTATRAIEAAAAGSYGSLPDPESQRYAREESGMNGSVSGWTDLFIRPGHSFRAVDSLITNFHLPRSTPLMLAAALCGREKLLRAYYEAITVGYRFFSYGDAMLIL